MFYSRLSTFGLIPVFAFLVALIILGHVTYRDMAYKSKDYEFV